MTESKIEELRRIERELDVLKHAANAAINIIGRSLVTVCQVERGEKSTAVLPAAIENLEACLKLLKQAGNP